MTNAIDKAEVERVDLDAVRSLLAVLNHDGGHHVAEHGIQSSAEAALATVNEMRLALATASPAPAGETREAWATFEEAWAAKEREGYQYGEDALEQVRFGWELARTMAPQREDGKS